MNMIIVANLVFRLLQEELRCNADATHSPQVLSNYRILLQDVMNVASSDHECLHMQDITAIEANSNLNSCQLNSALDEPPAKL